MYFNIAGPAEACRLAFSIGGVKFTDNRIDYKEVGVCVCVMIVSTYPFAPT